MAGLIVCDKNGKPMPASFNNPTSDFRKGPPPSQMGERFGAWAGRDLSFINLPGGTVLQFDLSRLTLSDYRGMRDHYQVNICLAMLMFLVHQLDWKIESTNQKQATQIEDNLKEVWPQLVRGYCQAHWAGYSPMAMEVDNNSLSSSIEVTKFKDLLPEECWVNWKVVDGYAPPGRVQPKIHVYNGINQFGVPTIPVENSLWMPLLMENGDYYGRKLLRSAFPSWFFSILLHLYSNRYFERFGEPVPVGRAPFDEDIEGPGGQMMNGREAMEGIITQLRNRSVVVLPSDRETSGVGGTPGDYLYSLEYLESQMRGADFERYLGRLDEEISLAMFTPLLVTRTSDVGSYNLGVGHLQMYLWMLNGLASDFKVYVDAYCIDRLKVWNYGPKAPPAKFVFRSMGKENIEILKGIVDQSIRKGDIKPDIDELSKAVGMNFEDTSNIWDPLDVAQVQTPGQPPQDTRPPRGRGATPAGPRSVGDKRPTGRKVAASVSEDVVRAFNNGSFGTGFSVQIPVIGGGLEGQLEDWVTDVADLGPDAFEGPEDFLSRLASVAEQGIRELVTT